MTAFSSIQFVILTGDDDLRDSSAAIADVLGSDGTVLFTVLLKEHYAPSWPSWKPQTVEMPLILPVTAIGGVRINLIQNKSSDPFATADNWDIARLNVNLLDGANVACQLDLVGNTKLQDGTIGLVRLSQNADSSGDGPSSPNYWTGPNSGCPPSS